MIALRRLRIAFAAGALSAAAALCLALPAASSAAASLQGSFLNGARFPARTMVLSAPAGITVDVPHMYIWENGGPVYYLKVTPMSGAGAGDFGVELVIDQSTSMAGAPLQHALAAARAFAAQRRGNEELGVIGFDSAASTVLPLTSDASAISHVLSATPWTGSGTRILPAVALALQHLQTAKIAVGAVIVLSDGAATRSRDTRTVQSVTASARRQHVPIYTVGLRDHSYTAGPLRELADQTGGSYVTASGGQLPNVFRNIRASLTRRYLIRYRSGVAAGRPVQVKIHVDGVSTMLHLGYTAPGTPASSPPGRITLPTTGGQLSAAPAPGTSGSPNASQAASGAANASQAVSGVQRIPSWKPARAKQTFWTSTNAPFVVAGACALLLGLAIAMVLARNPSRRALQRRVGTFIDAGQVDSPDRERPVKKGALDQLLTRRSWWPGFTEQMQAARIDREPLSLVKRAGGIALVAAILVALITGIPFLALPVLVAAPFVVRGWVSHLARKQRKLFAEQLPSNLQDLAGAMRAGRSFVGAIAAVAETSSEPMRGELERALTDERLGLPLEDTLEAIGRRMQAKDVEQIALIAALNRTSGSNVAEALDRVAEGARERADLAREIRSLTGQARLSSWVLSGLPPAMLVGLSVLAPQYSQPLFHTTMGIVMLVVAGVMVAAGWGVMRKIVDPEG